MGELSNLLKEKNFQETSLQKFIVGRSGKTRFSIKLDSCLLYNLRSGSIFLHLGNKIPAGKAKRKPDVRLSSLVNTFKMIVLMAICIIIVLLIYFPCST